MVEICALASGSNGNCYYIGNEDEAVIIDIGITNKQFTLRMNEAGFAIHKVKGLFISHEHTDHIKGMRVTCAKNNIQGYATRKTFNNSRNDYQSDKVSYFEPGDIIEAGNIRVHSFAKPHDAVEPVSFRIEIDNINIAVITDLGEATDAVIEHLKICNAAFLESNYEHNILENGPYPYFLKQRVSSNYGHLSNDQSVELVKSLNGAPLKTIFLSHISADNNRVDLALDKFKELSATHDIYPTSRSGISEVARFSCD